MPYLLSLLGADAAIADSTHQLCYYTNDTERLQVVRLHNGAECLFQRVVFPNERVLFAALADSRLEVSATISGTVKSNTIDSAKLWVHQPQSALTRAWRQGQHPVVVRGTLLKRGSQPTVPYTLHRKIKRPSASLQR